MIQFIINYIGLIMVVWCRRTDELVDGPNSSLITPNALEKWEQRLCDIFEGHPYDIYDVALSNTVSKYSLHIQVFTCYIITY